VTTLWFGAFPFAPFFLESRYENKAMAFLDLFAEKAVAGPQKKELIYGHSSLAYFLAPVHVHSTYPSELLH